MHFSVLKRENPKFCVKVFLERICNQTKFCSRRHDSIRCDMAFNFLVFCYWFFRETQVFFPPPAVLWLPVCGSDNWGGEQSLVNVMDQSTLPSEIDQFDSLFSNLFLICSLYILPSVFGCFLVQWCGLYTDGDEEWIMELICSVNSCSHLLSYLSYWK